MSNVPGPSQTLRCVGSTASGLVVSASAPSALEGRRSGPDLASAGERERRGLVTWELGDRGDLARVRWISLDGSRLQLDYRNGQSATVTSDDEELPFEAGNVVLVDPDTRRITVVDEEFWPVPIDVGVVKLKNESATVVEVSGRLRLMTEGADVEYREGNTVELTDTRITRVLSEDPVRLLDLPAVDDAAIASFRNQPGGVVASFDDFGGLRSVVERARELIELPLERHRELKAIGARPVKGVLFTGLPGTGKTMLARIIASRADAVFYEISGPQIFSKWYGQSEEMLRRIFEDAARQERAIIFFDEIDSVAAQRDEDAHEASKRVVAQLLTLMDGFGADENVRVIATTNRPQDIDVALRRPGRFDWEIAFPLPDRGDRLEILEISARHLRTSAALPHALVADLTDGWSGAELAAIWTEAALLAVADRRDVVMTEDYLGGVERVTHQRQRVRLTPAEVPR